MRKRSRINRHLNLIERLVAGLLWSMPYGKGTIIATGLNVIPPTNPGPATADQRGSAGGAGGGGGAGETEHPEMAWVLDRLLRYALSLTK